MLQKSGSGCDSFSAGAEVKPVVWVCGVDEAGRGPLAGPVYAAAVILDDRHPIAGLADSKKLSEKKAQSSRCGKSASIALAWPSPPHRQKKLTGSISLQASLLAMKRAIESLSLRPHEVLVDGLYCPDTTISSRAIVKGDSSVAAISAASILAKTARMKRCS